MQLALYTDGVPLDHEQLWQELGIGPLEITKP